MNPLPPARPCGRGTPRRRAVPARPGAPEPLRFIRAQRYVFAHLFFSHRIATSRRGARPDVCPRTTAPARDPHPWIEMLSPAAPRDCANTGSGHPGQQRRHRHESPRTRSQPAVAGRRPAEEDGRKDGLRKAAEGRREPAAAAAGSGCGAAGAARGPGFRTGGCRPRRRGRRSRRPGPPTRGRPAPRRWPGR